MSARQHAGEPAAVIYGEGTRVEAVAGPFVGCRGVVVRVLFEGNRRIFNVKFDKYGGSIGCARTTIRELSAVERIAELA